MKLFYFYLTICLVCTHLLNAQSKYISNSSFEGTTGQGKIPPNWYSCNLYSTPDIEPYFTELKPTDGFTFLGLVMRGYISELVEKNEDVTTKLLKPLYRDTTYYLSVDVAFTPYVYDIVGNDTLYYDNPSRIRVSGGTDSCATDEVFIISNLITNTSWSRLNFKFTPTTDNCTYLKIEIFSDTKIPSYIVLDNLSLSGLEIIGDTSVCRGQQNTVYTIPDIECARDFKWNYTGNEAHIIDNNDSIMINFDSTSTSGILSVSFNNCDNGYDTLFFPIRVSQFTGLGLINGNDEICSGQYEYYSITNSTLNSYTWSYSGSGAYIYGNSDSISVYFTSSAKDGVLEVTGNGECSSYLPITILSKPSDIVEIFGEEEVCQNQNNVLYKINEVDNADSYIWTYTGGDAINDSSDKITLDFSNNLGSGLLYVRGKNVCGTGAIRSKYITVNEPVTDSENITGNDEICANQGTEWYYTGWILNSDEYIWSYSGTGVNIYEYGSSIEMFFDENATNGILTVAGKNHCGTGPVSRDFPITVRHIPSGEGEINGETNVCVNSGDVFYQTSGIEDVTDYSWEFSGSGDFISSNSDHVTINFNQNYSNGILKVTGSNSCGTGSTSAELLIRVTPLPSMPEITGENQICVNQKSIFNIEPDGNTTDYKWNYSGNGEVLYSNGNEINIEVNSIGDAGILTATGINRCGSGEISSPVNIYADLCDLHIPNTFSPNNDGVNDVFVIRGLPINSNLIVFDRLGRTLFESKNYQNDWDGKNNRGELLPTGTYWYILTIEGIFSKYKGSIYLKR